MNEAAESPLIRIRDLRKSFGKLEVLRSINLDIPEGQVVSIIGPSGSGKSTLLRVLMTLEWPTAGRVEIDGESLFTMRRNGREIRSDQRHLRRVRGNIGMVFQHFNLFPHMKVLRNVTEAPMHVLGLGKEEAAERAREVLAKVGLADKLDAYPAQLSGGQKQRVAIARGVGSRA
jgi:polar amino acid transport system ATP-binding protein